MSVEDFFTILLAMNFVLFHSKHSQSCNCTHFLNSHIYSNWMQTLSILSLYYSFSFYDFTISRTKGSSE